MITDDLFPGLTTMQISGQIQTQDEPAVAGAAGASLESADSPAEPLPDPRLRLADRRQVLLEACCLEDKLPPDHPARIVLALVEKWNLTKFLARVQARGSRPGRPATDPKILLSLWLFAYTEGVGGGRELDELCHRDDPYKWLCGGVSLNYHTLNDFRVEHEKELDDLLTQMIAVLQSKELIDVHRIAQDGTRVRAGAGSNSFKKKSTLEEHQKKAREHVEAVKGQQGASARQQAAQQRAADEKLARLNQALEEVGKIEEAKSKQKEKPTKHHEAKASETDPEARPMKMPGGGSRPGFNVQFATTVVGRAIVGVQVTNAGSDAGLDGPMREEVIGRTGEPVTEQLLDGGYVKLDAIDAADQAGVTIYMPVPKAKKKDADRHAPRATDSEEVASWRERMGGVGAELIYRQRASTIETVNAETRTYRGLEKILVRGLNKVRCIALCSALAYMIVHFGMNLAA